MNVESVIFLDHRPSFVHFKKVLYYWGSCRLAVRGTNVIWEIHKMKRRVGESRKVKGGRKTLSTFADFYIVNCRDI